ncbi:MAG: hypothetical protein AB1894_05595 [Chloroflexota bacterium]
MFFNDLPAPLQPTYQSDRPSNAPIRAGQPGWPPQGYELPEGAPALNRRVVRLHRPAWVCTVCVFLGDLLIRTGSRLKERVAADPLAMITR